MQHTPRSFVNKRGATWHAGVVALLGALALLTVSVTTASAATGTLYAQSLTGPAGGLWLKGSLGGHLWVSDSLQGFCRVDAGALNTSTCIGGGATKSGAPVKPGQPAFDPARSLIYVPDSSGKTTGLWRLTFNPATELVSKTEAIATTAGIGALRPEASVLLPGGAFLYLGFHNTGSVTRVNGPALGTTQGIHTIGHSSDGRRVLGLAILGSSNTLHLAETTMVTVMPTTCTSNCVATPHPSATLKVATATPLSLVADPLAGMLYVGTATSVFRFNSHTGAVDTYAQSSTTGTRYANVMGMALQPAAALPAALYALDDPTKGATLLTGRAFRIELNQAPLGPGGSGGAPPPAGISLTTGILFTQSLTTPAGGVWIGTHLWVSDATLGFCRIDAGTFNQSTCIGGAAAKAGAPVKPGEAVFDAVNNQIYVTDLSGKSVSGIWRLTFNPATETITAVTQIAMTAALGANRPVGLALTPNGGSLYVSFRINGNIVRITGPATGTTQAAPVIGASADGRRVLNIAMIGTALYLTEGTAVTRIAAVDTCAGSCLGAVVPGLTGMAAPTALAADAAGRLYIGNANGVLRFTFTTGKLDSYASASVTGIAFTNVGAIVVQPGANVYALDDPSAGLTLFAGRAWQMPLLP